MITWVVCALAFSQIILLYGCFFGLSARITYDSYIARNRQWVADNPSFQKRFPPPRYSIWLAYLMGAVWIAILVRVFFITADGSWLPKSLLLPAVPFVLLWLLYAGMEYLRVCKRVPLPDKRRTSLQRRELRDFLSPLWVYLAYLLAAGLVATDVGAFLAGTIELRPFRALMIGLISGALVCALVLRYSLRRRDAPLDDLLGPAYRKLEVILAVGVLYLLVLLSVVATLRMSGIIPPSATPLAAPLMLNVVLQLWALYCLLGAPLFPRKGGPGAPHASSLHEVSL